MENLPARPGRLARTAKILGAIGWWVPLLAPIALLLGLAVVIRAAAARDQTDSRSGWQAVRTATGSMVTWGLLALVFIPVFMQAKEKAIPSSCRSNLKQLATATLMYAQDYDDHLPLAHNWCEETYPYIKDWQVYRCPKLPDVRCGYAFNIHLSGLVLSRITSAATTPSLFDAPGFWDLAGGPGLLSPRHDGYANLAFVDGHVKAYQPGSAASFRWIPVLSSRPETAPVSVPAHALPHVGS